MVSHKRRNSKLLEDMESMKQLHEAQIIDLNNKVTKVHERKASANRGNFTSDEANEQIQQLEREIEQIREDAARKVAQLQDQLDNSQSSSHSTVPVPAADVRVKDLMDQHKLQREIWDTTLKKLQTEVVELRKNSGAQVDEHEEWNKKADDHTSILKNQIDSSQKDMQALNDTVHLIIFNFHSIID